MSRFMRNVVKEALDNLPSGTCFFDTNSVLRLCNYRMYSLFYNIAGKDLQALSELRDFLERGTVLAQDGSAWYFREEQIITADKKEYTQVTAVDVTKLYQRQNELRRENLALSEYGERMKALSNDMLALIRNEEMLDMKMRVHYDIGRSVIATRMYLQQSNQAQKPDLTVWKNAVRLLKHEIKPNEKTNAVARLRSEVKSIGVNIHIEGELPENNELLTAAIRECATNAARYAEARDLYVKIKKDDQCFTASITNSGLPVKGEISEGGGLTSLRHRVENGGGKMTVKTDPISGAFELTIESRV